jgi:hypothetical protein
MNKQLLILFVAQFSMVSCERDNNESNLSYEERIKDILDCMNTPRPEGSYNYPVLPGMEEWKSFNSTQEMIDACQVPESQLKLQSTQAVFQALWEYPFFIEATSRSDHYQMDFETIFSNNSAYSEFITRQNAGECLLSRLLIVKPLFPVYPKVLELFISQPIFLNQLTSDEKKEVVSISLKNDSLRQVSLNTAGGRMREVTWLLIGRTMYYANYKPFVEVVEQSVQLKTFITSSVVNVSSQTEYDQFFQFIISSGKTYQK